MKNKQTKRRNLLILEEVCNKITQEEGEFCLFGIENYVRMPETGTYNFIFHATEGIPFDHLDRGEFLSIPVLGYQLPEDSSNAYAEIKNLHMKHPNISTYAVRNKSERSRGQEEDRKKTAGTYLKFLHVSSVDLGVEITEQNDYVVTNEEELEKNFTFWNEINQRLTNLREKINQEYI
jgi:hypothetical protein